MDAQIDENRPTVAAKRLVEAKGKAPEKTSFLDAVVKDEPARRKKKRRLRAGTRALMEIKKYQKSVDTQIPKASMERLIREILQDFTAAGQALRLKKSAVEALHEGAEVFLTEIAEMAQKYAVHAKRVTIMPPDVALAVEFMSNRQ